jgi:hypothetical protein
MWDKNLSDFKNMTQFLPSIDLLQTKKVEL